MSVHIKASAYWIFVSLRVLWHATNNKKKILLLLSLTKTPSCVFHPIIYGYWKKNYSLYICSTHMRSSRKAMNKLILNLSIHLKDAKRKQCKRSSLFFLLDDSILFGSSRLGAFSYCQGFGLHFSSKWTEQNERVKKSLVMFWSASQSNDDKNKNGKNVY